MSLCRIIDLNQMPEDRAIAEAALHGRQPGLNTDVARRVAKVLRDIEQRGIRAALASARKFDAPGLSLSTIAVSEEEMAGASVDARSSSAIRCSIQRVTHFHKAQLAALTKGWKKAAVGWAGDEPAWEWSIPATDAPGSGTEGQRMVPAARVGVYVPGGKAAYPSSVIMNAVPALVAGVPPKNLSICTPARPDGSVSPGLLVAARELGIGRIVKVGGAAAVALMAFGDRSGAKWRFGGSWPSHSVIAGPGSSWVNEAKRQLWGRVGMDSYAGPSEVCVVADESAYPGYAAADLLTQVEHAEDNFGLLITTSRAVADRILEEAERQLSGAARESTMRAALQNFGLAIVCADLESACRMACSARAEHVTVMTENLDQASRAILSGGCILLGDYTPQSAGDFASGPSHTLPTNLGARFASPVNVMTFLKFQSISRLTKEDLAELRPTIEAFSEMEGFPQHGRGASIRFEG